MVANEDYNGVNPTYPPGTSAEVRRAPTSRRSAGPAYRAAVWDVSTQGVPHHLGVLSHFTRCVWYLGDNRLTQDPEDELTEIFGSASSRTSRWPSASST